MRRPPESWARSSRFAEDDILAFYEELRGFTRRVAPTERLDAVPGDETDNKILECAVAADADTLVTGDVHLLSIGTFRGIRIQRVAEFLASFQTRGR